VLKFHKIFHNASGKLARRLKQGKAAHKDGLISSTGGQTTVASAESREG